MHPFMTVVALFAAASIKLSGSQSTPSIDPNSVDQETKEIWCNDQKSTCPLLCLQIPEATDSPLENECTASSLDYTCLCSNGQRPNASEYSLTIPFHVCRESGNQCVRRCGQSDSACQNACVTKNPCGAQSPTRVNTSTISTMLATSSRDSAASTAEATAVYTGFGGGSTSSQSNAGNSLSTRALVISFGKIYGHALVLAGLCAGFVLML